MILEFILHVDDILKINRFCFLHFQLLGYAVKLVRDQLHLSQDDLAAFDRFAFIKEQYTENIFGDTLRSASCFRGDHAFLIVREPDGHG